MKEIRIYEGEKEQTIEMSTWIDGKKVDIHDMTEEEQREFCGMIYSFTHYFGAINDYAQLHAINPN